MIEELKKYFDLKLLNKNEKTFFSSKLSFKSLSDFEAIDKAYFKKQHSKNQRKTIGFFKLKYALLERAGNWMEFSVIKK